MPQKAAILIVDDDEHTLRLIQTFMSKFSHPIHVANSGGKALELIETHGEVIQLAFLDLAMPIVSGYDVCRAIRSNPVTADVPTIALTARVDIEAEELAFGAGFTRIIHKPFNLKDLETVINQYLGN